MPDLNPASPTAREVLQALDTTGNRQPWVPTIDEQCADEDWLRNHSSYHRKKPKPMLTDFRITTRDDGFSATFQRNGKVVCVFVSDDLAAHADASEHLRTLADEIEHLSVPSPSAAIDQSELASARGIIIRMAELVPFFAGNYNPGLYSGCAIRCEEASAWLREHPAKPCRPPATVDQVAVARIEREAHEAKAFTNWPVTAEQRAEMQGEVDKMYAAHEFRSTVTEAATQAEAGAYGDHEHEHDGEHESEGPA